MAPRVKLTNADKVLYPATGTTKADIFDYYTSIAEVMVPHIAGRPATRKRWPNGVDDFSFFEKQLASSAPDWLPRASVTHRSGTTTYPIIDSADALAWIAQQAALEVHVPQWRFVAEWTRKGEAAQTRPGNPIGVRSGPRRRRDDGAAVRSGPCRAGSDHRHRADHLSAHQRQQGHAPLRAAG